MKLFLRSLTKRQIILILVGVALFLSMLSIFFLADSPVGPDHNPMETIKELEKATEIDPEKMEGWRQLALALAQAGQMDQAVEAQRYLLMLHRKQDPESYLVEAEIFETMARMELGANRLKDAERTAWKLNRLVPGVPHSQLLLAQTLRANGKEEEARRQAQIALDIDPGYTAAKDFLANR
jgi:predicted Zn-dependent protease